MRPDEAHLGSVRQVRSLPHEQIRIRIRRARSSLLLRCLPHGYEDILLGHSTEVAGTGYGREVHPVLLRQRPRAVFTRGVRGSQLAATVKATRTRSVELSPNGVHSPRALGLIYRERGDEHVWAIDSLHARVNHPM